MRDRQLQRAGIGEKDMEFEDKILQCQECDSAFVFTAEEQVFFREKQFIHEPRRCRKCRAKRSLGQTRARLDTKAICASCGLETTVPFRPTKGLPVFCRSCFREVRNTVGAENKKSNESVEKELVQ